jgi:hypothetical protein
LSGKSRNQKDLRPITIKAAPTGHRTPSVAANLRRVAAESRRFKPFALPAHRCRDEKASRLKRLSLMDACDTITADKFVKRLKPLPSVAGQLARPQPLQAPKNPNRREALEHDARLAHGSNINSASESCGKLKATPLASIFHAATAGFFAAGK